MIQLDLESTRSKKWIVSSLSEYFAFDICHVSARLPHQGDGKGVLAGSAIPSLPSPGGSTGRKFQANADFHMVTFQQDESCFQVAFPQPPCAGN